MIRIKISNKFLIEKKYIMEVVFGEFLGVDYQIVVGGERGVWEIVLENNNRLEIADRFFVRFGESFGYLSKENIPAEVKFVKNQFLAEDDIPVVYGDEKLVISQEMIVCGIDIFASIFFMLTRWEEYVNKTRDQHNRFPAHASLAYKNGFLDRPVVNEYIEMLWNLLLKLGIRQERKENIFEMVLTHDVDRILKYAGMLSGCKEICGDLLRQFNLSAGFGKIIEKILVHLGRKKDPFDSFDYLMDLSEKVALKSHFFIMGEGTSRYDNAYNTDGLQLKKIIHKIKERGHNIGLHSTYNSYNDREQFAKEKAEIENLSGAKVATGRQHYLRFEAPVTWQVWEDNGMEWDSTLSYADRAGFRCGTCYEYSVFNFLTRKHLKLKEKPLIVMDGSFVTYQPELTPKDMDLSIRKLMAKCQKYKGTLVLLWHNSSFGVDKWEPFEKVYSNIVLGGNVIKK